MQKTNLQKTKPTKDKTYKRQNLQKTKYAKDKTCKRQNLQKTKRVQESKNLRKTKQQVDRMHGRAVDQSTTAPDLPGIIHKASPRYYFPVLHKSLTR
jgi:hypothetical protein